VHCFGVFDGHSIGGDVASTTAAKSFEKNLAKRITSTTIEDKVVNALFKSVHQEILAVYDNPPASVSYASPSANKLVKWSLRKAGQMQFYTYGGKYDRPIEFGTTALVVLVSEATKECTICWAGDSRAILLSRDEEDDEFIEVTSLNDLHNARNVKEKKRVETGFPAVIHSDGYLQPKDGYYKNMQINMTRAMGHRVLQNFGVIPDPSVKRVKLTAHDQYIVIATDGLWENLSDAEVRDIVVEHGNPKHAANALIERISQYDPSSADVDNVTVLVVSFEIIGPKVVATAGSASTSSSSMPIPIPTSSSKSSSSSSSALKTSGSKNKTAGSPEEVKPSSPTKKKKSK
jgi:serine/threonine protein phosphatase PrpC